MSDEELTPSSLQKRHRNVMVFSVAVMIIGWAPAEMQSTFYFVGIQFSNIDPQYMWGWATAINLYLFLAWIYTSRADEQWLYLRGDKFNTLLRNKDFFWLRYFVRREHRRHSFKKKTFGLSGETRTISKCVKQYEMVTENKAIYKEVVLDEKRPMFISEGEFKQNFRFPPQKKGHLFCIYEGRHHRETFWLVTEFSSGGRGNPKKVIRQTLAELYFSILPALLIGSVGLATASINLISATEYFS